jgi:hypothetical protein
MFLPTRSPKEASPAQLVNDTGNGKQADYEGGSPNLYYLIPIE